MHGKAVLVTGASSGIGEACVRRLIGSGYQVYAGVRQEKDGAALQRSYGTRVVPVLLDITDTSAVSAAAEYIASSLGGSGLYGLVNNAGIVIAGPLEFLPLDELRRQFEVNLFGQLAVTQAVLPLIRQAQGRIVMIGSLSGRVASPLVGPYCASKFALEALSAALRMELSPWRIPVSMIQVGSTATPIWQKTLRWAEAAEQQLPGEASRRYGRQMAAMRRYTRRAAAYAIQPQAVAGAVQHALGARRPRQRYIVGLDARLAELLRVIPERLRERMMSFFLSA